MRLRTASSVSPRYRIAPYFSLRIDGITELNYQAILQM
jgi:hypothetical protein